MDVTELTGRLRSWPRASWQRGDRVETTRRTLQRLADLAGTAPPTVRVPTAGWHALGDQLAVLHAEAADAGVEDGVLAALIQELARDLGLAGRHR